MTPLTCLQVPAAVINVTVHPCEVGQVPQAGTVSANTTTCTLCPANTFSWDPNDPNCQPCPQNAQCNGSASVVPQPTYVAAWWGSPNMVMCPNPNACQRNMTDLGICQNATFHNKIASVQVSPVSAVFCTCSATSCTKHLALQWLADLSSLDPNPNPNPKP